MNVYTITHESTVREVYQVEADSEYEALEVWPDDEPVFTEVIDRGVIDVEVTS